MIGTGDVIAVCSCTVRPHEDRPAWRIRSASARAPGRQISRCSGAKATASASATSRSGQSTSVTAPIGAASPTRAAATASTKAASWLASAATESGPCSARPADPARWPPDPRCRRQGSAPRSARRSRRCPRHPADLALGLLHPRAPGTGDDRDRRDAGGPVRERRDRRGAADRVDLLDTEDRRGGEDLRGRQAIQPGGLATAIRPTPATWAGTTAMTRLDGYAARPPGT